MTTRRTATASITALVAGVALASCSLGGSDDAADTSTTSAASSDGATSDSATSGDDADANAQQAGIDPNNPPKPLASVEMPAVTEDDKPTTMTADLLAVRREDKLLVVTYGFTPKDGDSKPQWLYGWLGDKTWSPQVVDTTNLKVHDVVRAEGGGFVKTEFQGTVFGPGSTYYAFAVFAAPPADATLTIKAADGAPPFSNVKVP